MPLRERLKQSVKSIKGDAKVLFERIGGDPDKNTTRPTTTSSTHPHAIGPAITSGLVGSAVDAVKFGPLRSLSDILGGFADMYIVDNTVKKEYDALQQRLQKLLELLEEHSDEEISPKMKSKVQDIRGFIEKELSTVGIQQVTAQPRRLLMAREHEERFIASCQRIQTYMDMLLVGTSLSMWKMEEQQSMDRMSSLVDRLPFSSSARYNSSVGAELKRRECTPGTRIEVLATLLAWARNNTNSGVYWLNGMAGTGKTTIAYSVCKELDGGLYLAASFFCSRLREECRDVNLIIPSIAYQLAQRSHPFQSALSAVIEKNPDVHTRRLDLQFKELLEEPLLSAKPTFPEGLIVVIDALDECDNKETTRDILHVLLTKAEALPIRFVVSSRPEPQIRDHMAEQQVNSGLVLHELDTGSVQADIKKYLEYELKPMKPPPTDAQIAALVEKAGILFIYAATAVRFIGYDHFHRNPSTRLRTILDGSPGRKSTENKGVDQLYMAILDAAFGDEELEDIDREDMQQVLHTVICAREPLTVDALSKLLQMNDPDRVQAALRPLWSVVHVVTGSELVTTLHASFPDYMFDVTRSKTYWCDSNTQHRELAEGCFERIQKAYPQLNILGLQSSYLLDEDVKDIEERVARGIPLELLYACRYWADHMKAGDNASSVIGKLRDFLSIRLLLWMEVLNLYKQIVVGMECMKQAVSWCTALKDEQGLIELTQDAKRFVDAFASNPVSQSTPHLYVSMLAFWPRSSPIGKHYAKYTQGPVKPEGAVLDRRQSAHLSTWGFDKRVGAMAVSPDGLYLALGIGKEVAVVDLSSGKKLLEPLRGPTGYVASIAFSAGSARIFAGFVDYRVATIVGWDTRSGDTALGPLPLHGHTSAITRFSFSLGSTRIVTCSKDQSVRLWDAETGNLLHHLRAPSEFSATIFSSDGTLLAIGSGRTMQLWDSLTGGAPLATFTHTSCFDKIAFSPDNLRIISASVSANVIYVWNTQTGDMILEPIKGHTDFIQCIGSSPDGRYIVSGSKDRTVRVWDAQNGSMVLGPLEAHKNVVTLVAFTPDGSRIISACTGGLVCTWDAQQPSLVSSFANTPSHRITCVKFSSDGTQFASGSQGGKVSIWDAYTGERRAGPIKTHTSRVNALDFLNDRVVFCLVGGTLYECDALTRELVLGPLQTSSWEITAFTYSLNGQMIATCSYKGIVVWNAQDGNRVLGPLTALAGSISSVQFSPDGTRIVAGSSASISNVAVLDISTGESVFGTLDGHTRAVNSLAYSPNGALIASGSNDGTIIVWDAYTGEKRFGPLTAHSHFVLSVHFSPDSTRLVSGSLSFDRTIRIWDVQTGDMVFELPTGHEDGITSVEYSPNGTRILSRSDDMSVRIHDARSPSERARSFLESEVGDWTIKNDGWVVDDQSRLLAWVPGDLRKTLMWPRTEVIVGPHRYFRLKFEKSRMGESWAECYTSGM